MSNNTPYAAADVIGNLVAARFTPRVALILGSGLGDCPASGTEIINRLGDLHLASGKPILYTSGDSVLQIAAHETAFGLERLHALCKLAFKLVAPYNIGRVIARPFIGADGHYTRTAHHHDYAVKPPGPTLLDHVEYGGGEVVALGKVGDIFANQGISRQIKADGNMALFDALLKVMNEANSGALVFVNFVDFDQLGRPRKLAGKLSRCRVLFHGAIESSAISAAVLVS